MCSPVDAIIRRIQDLPNNFRNVKASRGQLLAALRSHLSEIDEIDDTYFSARQRRVMIEATKKAADEFGLSLTLRVRNFLERHEAKLTPRDPELVRMNSFAGTGGESAQRLPIVGKDEADRSYAYNGA